MFYVEVHLDSTGLLCDVKVAHHGENPVVCITNKKKMGNVKDTVCQFVSPQYKLRELIVWNMFLSSKQKKNPQKNYSHFSSKR